MVEITGNNLDERKKELNIKIIEAAKNKTDFNEVKCLVETSDVDKLYKIGVASEYKDVDYIIEILKSGDSLFISKAVKCIWLYDSEYANIINPEYLHSEIFPFMSLHMTKKFLTTISMYIRDLRAIDFYIYCKKMKHKKIAMKFIIYTPEEFKLESLKDEHFINYLINSYEVTQHFLGNSINLAEAYYNKLSPEHIPRVLHQFKHLYFLSEAKYLEMVSRVDNDWSSLRRLGLRISKNIIKKHKEEIFKYPITYLHLLNKRMLIQHSTINDAKFYAIALLTYNCPKVTDFWYNNFYDKHKYILDIIPFNQRLNYIKAIFTEQYPGQKFETTKQFYECKLHKLMTPEEQEKWALAHVESGLEILGSGRDYLWYKFISFDKAFPFIKKYIQVTIDVDVRSQIVRVLAKSAKTDKELETLLDYYYKRHVNEMRYYKERFVDTILSKHNVYIFNESCWEAFNKILFSLEVYNILDQYVSSRKYKIIALIYSVIHGKEVHEAIINHIDSGLYFYELKSETDKLIESDAGIVYQYLMEFYLNKIKSFNNQIYNNNVKTEVKKYINYVLDLMFQYKKPKENIPENVNKYISLDLESYKNHYLIKVEPPKLDQSALLRQLKKDKDLVILELPSIKYSIINENLRFNKFLKILRTYFKNDLAKIFLKLFQEIVTSEESYDESVKTSVYGIFQLAEIDVRNDFLAKYVPTEAKIDHSSIDVKFLDIQKSVCKMMCYCRPPVPLSDVTHFIKGDYVHFCTPMFNSFLMKLPKPSSIDFVKSLLDAPLSIQKHGIRMAFNCFNVDDLSNLILGVWNTTKNVSLRSIIYTSLHNKITALDDDDVEQNILFKDLIYLTNSLYEEDDDQVFKILSSDKLPRRFVGEYLEIGWNVVDKLPTKTLFMDYRVSIIDCFKSNVLLVKDEVIEIIIKDLLTQKKHINKNHNENTLIDSKFNLLYKFVTYYTDDDNFQKKLDIVMVVIKDCIKVWNYVNNEVYVVKAFLMMFVTRLTECSYDSDAANYAKSNILFEEILKELKVSLLPPETYYFNWYITFNNMTRYVIIDGLQRVKDTDNDTDCVVTDDYSLNAFADKFSAIIIESIKNEECYVSVFIDIENILHKTLNRILRHLKFKGEYNEIFQTMHVLVCSKLLMFESFETSMLALQLLPCKSNKCLDKKQYNEVLNKIKSTKYGEVKYCFYKKFMYI